MRGGLDIIRDVISGFSLGIAFVIIFALFWLVALPITALCMLFSFISDCFSTAPEHEFHELINPGLIYEYDPVENNYGIENYGEIDPADIVVIYPEVKENITKVRSERMKQMGLI